MPRPWGIRLPAAAHLPRAPRPRRRQGQRQGFTETDYAAAGCRAPAARRAARGHLGQPGHARQRRDDRTKLVAAGNGSPFTGSRRTRTSSTRLQYRPGLLSGFLANSGLDLAPSVTPTIKDRYGRCDHRLHGGRRARRQRNPRGPDPYSGPASPQAVASPERAPRPTG
jgi:hypothetical protein